MRILAVFCLVFPLPVLSQHTWMEIYIPNVVAEERPNWDFNDLDYFDIELYWNNPKIPLEKRIAIFGHVVSRLKFINTTFPKLENRVRIKRSEVTIPELFELLEEKLEAEIPAEIAINESIQVTVEVSGSRAFEVIEEVCAIADLDLIFTPDKIYIKSKIKIIEPDVR